MRRGQQMHGIKKVEQGNSDDKAREKSHKEPSEAMQLCQPKVTVNHPKKNYPSWCMKQQLQENISLTKASIDFI